MLPCAQISTANGRAWPRRWCKSSGLLAVLQRLEQPLRNQPVGERIGVTIWGFQRLVLAPDDAAFGEWYESVELPPTPYLYDRVLVTAWALERVLDWASVSASSPAMEMALAWVSELA